MQSVQAANRQIASSVAGLVNSYLLYTKALRGIAIGLLTGIGNGTKSFLAINRDLTIARNTFLDSIEMSIQVAVGNAAGSAIDALSYVGSSDVSGKEQAVADTLSKSFAGDMIARVSEQSLRDIRAVDNYLRKQLVQGRLFVGSQEIERELDFTFTDKSGRVLKSEDYLRREFNWSLRQLFNYLMIHGLLDRGKDTGVVSGGSKDGFEFSLAEFDKYTTSIFHYNSNALVSPTDNYSVT